MKTMMIGLALVSSMSSFASEFICKSDDFNASTYTGQSLTVVLDGNGIDQGGAVTEIEKNEGSWFCASDEDGKVLVKNPKLLTITAKANVYEADFGCDEWNGRLTIAKGQNPKWASYAFTFAADDRYRRHTSFLVCNPKP